MDKLVQELIRPFLEEDKREIVALYGGGFKPPTAGHFSVVEKTLQEYPEIDKLIVLVGKGVRDNIDQSQSILVWEIYQNHLPMKVEIQPSDVPIKEIYKYAENNPDKQIYWVLGAREGKEDDIKDIKARTSNLDKKRDKYNNIEVKIITTPDGGMSGSNARRSLLQGNQEEFFKFLPAKIKEKEEIFNILRPVVKENLTENTVPKINIFEKCKQLTLYMLTQGEEILPLPKLKIISDDSSNSEDFLGKTAYYDPNSKVIVLYIKNRHPKDIVRSFAHEMIHHKQNLEGRLNSSIQTTNTNEDDALQELEKEAYENGNIIFRNWTDSLQKGGSKKDDTELETEYEQKLTESDSAQIGPFYHETDPENIESILKSGLKTKEKGFQGAYLSISPAQPSGHYGDSILEIYLTPNQFLNALENTSHWVDLDPEELSLLEKTGMDLIMTANDLIQFPSFAQGELVVPFNIPVEQITLKGDKKTLNETIRHEGNNWVVYSKDGKKKLGTHKTKEKAEKQLQAIHIQQHKLKENITPQEKLQFYKEYFTDLSPSIFEVTIEGETIVIKGIDKSYSKNSTNENVPDAEDDGKAAPFGSGYEKINEGVYDSIVTQLSKKVLNAWISQFKENPDNLFALFEEDLELKDKKGRPLNFSLLAKLDFKKSKDRNYKVDGGANSGDEDEAGFVVLDFTVDPRELPKKWSTIAMDIRDVLRHEIEHLTQSGYNVRTSKELPDDSEIRDLIQKYQILPDTDYYKLDKEVDAMLQGLYFKAKKSKKPFKDVIQSYLDMVGLSPEDQESIKNRWRTRLKALSLPLFEIGEANVKPFKWEKKYERNAFNETSYAFKTDNGIEYTVNFAKEEDDEEGFPVEIWFNFKNKSGFYSLAMTNNPKEMFRVMATVIDIIKSYMKDHPEEALYTFEPAKETEDDNRRANLYLSYLKKHLSSEWKIRFDYEPNHITIERKRDLKEEMEKKDYTIYLDMDGVLVDFDKQFKSKTGMLPKDYENKYGTDKFWDFIDDSKKGGGVGFWRGMEWMLGGQELYNLASQYKHALLSSPSRSESSRIGKRLWRRDNVPQTKLILAYSANKKNYADKYSILIDDRADNIEDWRSKGGIGILYKSADQAINDLKQILGL